MGGKDSKREERKARVRKGRQEKGSHQIIISKKYHIGNCRVCTFLFSSDAVRIIFFYSVTNEEKI